MADSPRSLLAMRTDTSRFMLCIVAASTTLKAGPAVVILHDNDVCYGSLGRPLHVQFEKCVSECSGYKTFLVSWLADDRL